MAKDPSGTLASSTAKDAPAETPTNYLEEAERLANMAAADSTMPDVSHTLLIRAVQNLIHYIRKNV